MHKKLPVLASKLPNLLEASWSDNPTCPRVHNPKWGNFWKTDPQWFAGSPFGIPDIFDVWCLMICFQKEKRFRRNARKAKFTMVVHARPWGTTTIWNWFLISPGGLNQLSGDRKSQFRLRKLLLNLQMKSWGLCQKRCHPKELIYSKILSRIRPWYPSQTKHCVTFLCKVSSFSTWPSDIHHHNPGTLHI